MIDVLVVEDDPIARKAHQVGVQEVPGFRVAGAVGTTSDAISFCAREKVDLILLDLHLPDAHGLRVSSALRSAGRNVDVIAVTSARDLEAVRTAISNGVVMYLLKPFTIAVLRDKLLSYAEFRKRTGRTGEVAGQAEIDAMLDALRGTTQPSLPKGMAAPTLDIVVAALSDSPDGLSAVEVAKATGVSRVTARRYLEHLAGIGLAERRHHYGKVGRPEIRFYPVGSPDGTERRSPES
ncbi:MAG: response regulator [Nonomuraea sp.]|nr:response regulator [Nonomuraea sp.]